MPLQSDSESPEQLRHRGWRQNERLHRGPEAVTGVKDARRQGHRATAYDSWPIESLGLRDPGVVRGQGRQQLAPLVHPPAYARKKWAVLRRGAVLVRTCVPAIGRAREDDLAVSNPVVMNGSSVRRLHAAPRAGQRPAGNPHGLDGFAASRHTHKRRTGLSCAHFGEEGISASLFPARPLSESGSIWLRRAVFLFRRCTWPAPRRCHSRRSSLHVSLQRE